MVRLMDKCMIGRVDRCWLDDWTVVWKDGYMNG